MNARGYRQSRPEREHAQDSNQKAPKAHADAVIERGVVISTSGVFDIDRALPEASEKAAAPEAQAGTAVASVPATN